MTRPCLSCCLIVGDAHVSVLARCLKTILEAPGGPAASEIVIGWNGDDTPAFTDAVKQATGFPEIDVHSALKLGEALYLAVDKGEDLRLVLHEYAWKGDFAAARNDNFSHATGEWVYYIDVDDIIPMPGDPAFLDALEVDPPKAAVESYPLVGSLVDYFAALPAHVNVVLAPYNYVSTDKGRPVIRKSRPRAVRWSEGHFVWTSEVHEVLVSAFGRSVPVWAPGFVLVHAPVIAEDVRFERNEVIRDKQVEDFAAQGYVLPATLVYAQAIGMMREHRFLEASKRFEDAARSKDAGVEDRAYYLLMSARCAMEGEDHVRAGQMAVSVIDCNPARPEGYLSASEACFRLTEFAKCIAWYEASKGKRVPSGAMVDDRFERCLRPVAYAGIAYLRAGLFREAIEVADLALKEGSDPVASKVRVEAVERLQRQSVAERATGLAEALIDIGYLMTAKRVLGVVESFDEFRGTRRKIEERLGADTPSLLDEPVVGTWLAEPGYAAVTVPVDAAEDPTALLDSTIGRVPDGAMCRLATTDPHRGDAFASTARADGMEAERVLSLAERYGDVEALSLIEGEKSSYLLTEVRRQRHGHPSSRTPDITFFCPVFAEPWGPWRILKDGTGGSEESVIYLARELASRGYSVDVYAPLDVARHRGVHVEGGVRWRPIDSFDTIKPIKGAVIAQRAPWAVRFPAIDPKRLFVWHQDARYNVGWNAAIATTVRNLWVSKWQRGELLRAIGLKTEDHGMVDPMGAVVGNGIPQSAIDAPFQERKPFSCAYISSPVRGLAQLIELWPFIRSSFPEATLRVYYGWETLRVYPGMAKVQEDQLRAIRGARGVEHVGRMPQFSLERELTSFSHWTYPVHTFPEGWCVAGVRAAAAGLVPVYIRTAAMPEIQIPSTYSTPQKEWTQGGSGEYANVLLQALQDEKDGKITTAVRQGYRDWSKRWTWDHCATAVEAEMKRSGIFATAREVA
ncbi:MAG: hypothetical protein Q7R30_00055 [Acidobacteriota bacterium]|nr:hypothetical protein [Acidobacteriota bacterium]